MRRRCSIVLLVAACAGRTTTPEPPAPTITKQAVSPVSQLPTCTSGADLARHDGQRVVLVGIYRKRVVPKNKGQPPSEFYGQVQLELTGKATNYDPTAWDAALAVVQLGTDKRPDDEVATLADRKVAVEGRIVLHPPIEDPDIASPTPGPTLFEVGTVLLRK